MPGVRRYDLSQRKHLPAVPYYSQPHWCCAGWAFSHCLRSRFCTFFYSAIGEFGGISSLAGSGWGIQLDATQCKMARAALGIGVRELAARAVVSPGTVSRLEKGGEAASAYGHRDPRGDGGCPASNSCRMVACGFGRRGSGHDLNLARSLRRDRSDAAERIEGRCSTRQQSELISAKSSLRAFGLVSSNRLMLFLSISYISLLKELR